MPAQLQRVADKGTLSRLMISSTLSTGTEVSVRPGNQVSTSTVEKAVNDNLSCFVINLPHSLAIFKRVNLKNQNPLMIP